MINFPGFKRRTADLPAHEESEASALMTAADQLAALLAAENDALTGLDVPRAAGLVGEKARAIAAFELACLNMQGHHFVDVSQYALASELSLRLQSLALDNRRLLERAIGVQKRVLSLFARAAARANPGQYGASHYSAAPTATRQLQALALSAKA